MNIDDIKWEIEKAVKKILVDNGYELYPQLPIFCMIRQRIVNEIDIKLSVMAKKIEKEKKKKIRKRK